MTYVTTGDEQRDKLETRTTTPRDLRLQRDLRDTHPPTEGQPILQGDEPPYAHPGLLRNPEFVHTALQISGEKADWDSERLETGYALQGNTCSRQEIRTRVHQTSTSRPRMDTHISQRPVTRTKRQSCIFHY